MLKFFFGIWSIVAPLHRSGHVHCISIVQRWPTSWWPWADFSWQGFAGPGFRRPNAAKYTFSDRLIDLIDESSSKMESTGRTDCFFSIWFFVGAIVCLLSHWLFRLSYHCMRVSHVLSPYVFFSFCIFSTSFHFALLFYELFRIIALHFISLFHFVMLRRFTRFHMISCHFISHRLPWFHSILPLLWMTKNDTEWMNKIFSSFSFCHFGHTCHGFGVSLRFPRAVVEREDRNEETSFVTSSYVFWKLLWIESLLCTGRWLVTNLYKLAWTSDEWSRDPVIPNCLIIHGEMPCLAFSSHVQRRKQSEVKAIRKCTASQGPRREVFQQMKIQPNTRFLQQKIKTDNEIERKHILLFLICFVRIWSFFVSFSCLLVGHRSETLLKPAQDFPSTGEESPGAQLVHVSLRPAAREKRKNIKKARPPDCSSLITPHSW